MRQGEILSVTGRDEMGEEFEELLEPPEIDQMKKDELYDLEPQGSGQIRIALQWIYSKVKLLEDILMHLRFQIAKDRRDKDWYAEQLKNLESPIKGFLKTAMAGVAVKQGDRDLADMFNRIGTVSEEEKQYAKNVENFMKEKGLAKGPVRWARCTFIFTAIFTVLTCLIHFYKADFVNLTVVTLAIYLL